MSGPLVCCSLRKRPEWASLTSILLQQGDSVKWKETNLDTHDVALPLPSPGGKRQRVLRVILLSPSNVGTDECRGRTERLYHLNGGEDVAVVFLLKQEKDQTSPVVAMMTLQLDLGNFVMPIVPINSPEAVPSTLMALHRQLSTSGGSRRVANPAQTLIPYCSDRPPLSEHAVNVLTDITSNIRDLLDMMSTPTGREKAIEFLGNDSENAMSFWTKEYLIE
ncbi:uncharacterized protein GGS25DRAFT_472525 [Hypoxylon fragiforme]|uniref:uncharacterized protein n=1 Tax=Hypoxylon fragiforme TaxID=63214 RepID=UPI0020C6B436|nr:uncharacterized protein GGS25DRAFT_472525 [Hypoxylon fragiforme]KAI2614636.1 hypothetical protein GGS25DRAFT_472525 [Hypoxylon fragiforme]